MNSGSGVMGLVRVKKLWPRVPLCGRAAVPWAGGGGRSWVLDMNVQPREATYRERPVPCLRTNSTTRRDRGVLFRIQFPVTFVTLGTQESRRPFLNPRPLTPLVFVHHRHIPRSPTSPYVTRMRVLLPYEPSSTAQHDRRSHL